MKKTTYISDIDNFIHGLLEQNPELITKQQKLRQTWWDKDEVNLEQQENYNKSEVKAGAYVYFSYPTTK